MTERLPVLIIGGGPVGLALALLLARREVASIVVDARGVEAARSDRRLLALARGTVDLLRPIIELQVVGAPIRSVIVTSSGEFGRVVITEDDIGVGPLGVTVRYGDLVAPLARACEGDPHVTTMRPCRVQTIEQKPDAAHVTLDDGAKVKAALVVNAEGTAVTPTSTSARVGIVADVTVAGVDAGEAYERFTREGPLALLPLPGPVAADGCQLGLVWCMSASSAERRAALDDRAFMSELQRALGERKKVILRVGPRRSYPLHEQARPTLRAHRSVWIGNAAQTLHPVAGQGLNLGMRDAAQLSGAIAQATVAGRDLADALESYENHRRVDRGAIVALTRRLPGLFATRAAPVSMGRSLGLAALAAVPDLRREFARLLMFGVRA
ncbi:MAG TPA: FAD-dependent monooxygenase [Burkholderiaceae bacterium]|nr:FAD-dependent monooxygenase [Burkholderiaceae bacterium]